MTIRNVVQQIKRKYSLPDTNKMHRYGYRVVDSNGASYVLSNKNVKRFYADIIADLDKNQEDIGVIKAFKEIFWM